ncbi:MAG: caspase family protein [Deltaproteobacteria bacterium]|nr:caspase family protein [Deltaproteobacteria bacterium]
MKSETAIFRPGTFQSLIAGSILLMLFYITPPATAEDEVPIRRFAMVVGANNGGAERATLRYADTDAAAFANVLVQLGGVQKKDLLLITNAGRQDLVNGFTRITRMLKASRSRGDRTELIFYYSGHSDELGLLLENEVYTYREMRHQINTLPARVRVGILDSCASGALVRVKGGVRTAPFLVDASAEVEGVAILTSSAADEVAQESDKVGGSYFTHFLVSGMRGAADADRDGRVTLNESYAYAFDETLHRTTDTQAGAQHPNYDFRLAGAGDFVLTDLRTTEAAIIFAPEVLGRIYVRDSKGNLVAEINKSSNRPIRLGVQPGKYIITIDSKSELRRGKTTVGRNRPVRINGDSLQRISRGATVARGDGASGAAELDNTEAAPGYRPVAVGFAPQLSTNGRAPTRNSFALNFFGKGHSLDGLEIGAFVNVRTHHVNGMQTSGFVNRAGSLRGAQFSLVNVSIHQTAGYQAGLVNTSHTTIGMQNGLVNINGDTFTGYQAGLVNVTADMQGAQHGLVNIQSGDMKGWQAGLINYSASLDGWQTGLVNLGGFVTRGVQMGLVNAGEATTGLQIGLVNIAKGEFKGLQLGLVNYAGDGIFAPTAWVSDPGALNMGLKVGSRYTYGIFGSSLAEWGAHAFESAIFGIGVHLEFHPVWTEIDAIYEWKPGDSGSDMPDTDAIARLRSSVGYRLYDQVSVYAGISLNNLISENRDSVAISPGLSFIRHHGEKLDYELSLGMFVGIQWEPKWGQHNSWRGKKTS